jgi:hypothetical protein
MNDEMEVFSPLQTSARGLSNVFTYCPLLMRLYFGSYPPTFRRHRSQSRGNLRRFARETSGD